MLLLRRRCRSAAACPGAEVGADSSGAAREGVAGRTQAAGAQEVRNRGDRGAVAPKKATRARGPFDAPPWPGAPQCELLEAQGSLCPAEVRCHGRGAGPHAAWGSEGEGGCGEGA
eukprot:8022337-Alexandrium_andersonii.AAC.1